MLLKRMKKNSAAMKGKCFFHVHKEALRHEALCLLLLEDEHHNAEKRDGNEHPEDVLGETKRGVSDDGMGHEAVEQLVHRIRQLGKRVHYSSFLPQFASA